MRKINLTRRLILSLATGIITLLFAMEQRSDYREALSRNQIHQEELVRNNELLSKVVSLAEIVKEKQSSQEAYRDSLQSVLNTCM